MKRITIIASAIISLISCRTVDFEPHTYIEIQNKSSRDICVNFPNDNNNAEYTNIKQGQTEELFFGFLGQPEKFIVLDNDFSTKDTLLVFEGCRRKTEPDTVTCIEDLEIKDVAPIERYEKENSNKFNTHFRLVISDDIISKWQELNCKTSEK